MKPDTPAETTEADKAPQETRPSWWQRFLAWLSRGAAAAESERRGACPT